MIAPIITYKKTTEGDFLVLLKGEQLINATCGLCTRKAECVRMDEARWANTGSNADCVEYLRKSDIEEPEDSEYDLVFVDEVTLITWRLEGGQQR